MNNINLNTRQRAFANRVVGKQNLDSEMDQALMNRFDAILHTVQMRNVSERVRQLLSRCIFFIFGSAFKDKTYREIDLTKHHAKLVELYVETINILFSEIEMQNMTARNMESKLAGVFKALSFYEKYPHIWREWVFYHIYALETYGIDIHRDETFMGFRKLFTDQIDILVQNPVVRDDTSGDAIFWQYEVSYGVIAAKQRAFRNHPDTYKRIGSGTYGNVFRPPIAHPTHTDEVGKLFRNRETLEKELHISRVLSDIDQHRQFLKTAIEPDNENIKVLQLRFGYCGVNFLSYMRTHTPPTLAGFVDSTKLVISQMPPFVQKYMATFGKARLLHLDIKPDNVMYEEGTNTLNLIDFSFVANSSSVFDPSIHQPEMFHESTFYPFWPPELLWHHRPDLSEASLLAHLDTFKTYQIFRSPKIARYFDWRVEENKLRILPFSKKAPQTIDVWSIGMTFLQYLDVLCEFAETVDVTERNSNYVVCVEKIYKWIETIVARMIVSSDRRSMRWIADLHRNRTQNT